MAFDWRGGEIIRQTPLDSGYRNTQNVRRFLTVECGGGASLTARLWRGSRQMARDHG
ncbi:DUF6434 domain-containing protein [Tateyamaria sp.]|uniref:DUF6434 domain-containing protein n=1 Tax=Tateyamaria sp. TaxID=1929288 RepID=UPI0039B86C3D